MTHDTRGSAARIIGSLMIIVTIALPFQPMGGVAMAATSQAVSSQTAGSATVAFLHEFWQYDSASSDADTAFLTHAQLPGAVFIYGEIADFTVPDAETGIDLYVDGLFGTFGDGDHTVVESGVLTDGSAWRLYTVGVETVPHAAFVSANVTDIPGDVIVTFLISPMASFGEAVDSVQLGVSINGGLTTVDSFETEELVAALQGGSRLGVDEPTPRAVPLTGNVTVGDVGIGWGGDWEYNELASSPDQIAFFTMSSDPGTFFGYTALPSMLGDVSATLSQFTSGFFEQFGATNVVQVTTEVLPSGNGYSLFTADQAGVPLTILVFADGTTAPGEFRTQLLITPVPQFDATVAVVQQSFVIADVDAMSELDAIQLSSLLGLTPAPTEPIVEPTVAATVAPIVIPTFPSATAAPTTPELSATLVSSGVADFLAMDSEGTCDAIGWVMTAPGQEPSTDAEIDFRAACLGDGFHIAYCGIDDGTRAIAPEPGTNWIRCELFVLTEDGPVTLSPLDYSLVDGAGNIYEMDFMALFAMDGVEQFPESDLAEGDIGGGTLAFSVPVDATGPLVIEIISVESILFDDGTGRLVIDGDLPPFDQFNPGGTPAA